MFRGNSQICRFLFSLMLLSTLFTASCGALKMYPGPERAPEEIAILKIGEIVLIALDTQPPQGAESLAILPGEHTLRLSHNQEGFGEQVITYTFTAVAGHQYLLSAHYAMDRHFSWRPWVKDLASQEIIGRWK